MNIETMMRRRQFLKRTTILGGLAALLGIHRPATAEMKESQQPAKPSGQGYRLTEHVKKYYEAARR